MIFIWIYSTWLKINASKSFKILFDAEWRLDLVGGRLSKYHCTYLGDEEWPCQRWRWHNWGLGRHGDCCWQTAERPWQKRAGCRGTSASPCLLHPARQHHDKAVHFDFRRNAWTVTSKKQKRGDYEQWQAKIAEEARIGEVCSTHLAGINAQHSIS